MIKGTGIKSLAAGVSVKIEPTVGLDSERNVQFIVTNDSSLEQGYKLYVCGFDEKEATLVPSQQAVVIEDKDPFYVKAASDNDGACDYIIGQVFGGRIDVG